MNRDQLLTESRKLPRHERARFVLDLVRDLEEDNGSAVDAAELGADEGATHEAWTKELQRRWEEVRTGAVEPLTVEQFRERVRELRDARRR